MCALPVPMFEMEFVNIEPKGCILMQEQERYFHIRGAR